MYFSSPYQSYPSLNLEGYPKYFSPYFSKSSNFSRICLVLVILSQYYQVFNKFFQNIVSYHLFLIQESFPESEILVYICSFGLVFIFGDSYRPHVWSFHPIFFSFKITKTCYYNIIFTEVFRQAIQNGHKIFPEGKILYLIAKSQSYQ